MTLTNIISVILIAFILSGGLNSMFERAMIEPVPASNWYVQQDYGCKVYLPHGKKRCVTGTVRGWVVIKEGY
jgi:hypothetical protein